MLAVPVISLLVLSGVAPAWPQVRADAPPPPLVGEALRRVQRDFDMGGSARLSADWNSCIDQARTGRDSDQAEQCIVFGYAALRLGDSGLSVSSSPSPHHLTEEIVAPAQMEMLAIMGVPADQRQARLDRYRHWVLGGYARTAESGAPGTDADGDAGAPMDLARAADGKYPREALPRQEFADVLRRVAGQKLFSRLKDYTLGDKMEFTGEYTVGSAREPDARGVSEARFVFGQDEAWIGIISDGRMRIYGDPPSQARALLLGDRHQAAWEGIVEDMTHPVSPPVVSDAVEASTGDPPPRLTISPHKLLPAAADPAPPGQPDDGTTKVGLQSHDGVLLVPVVINNTLTLPFEIDSGASDVSVSADTLRQLIAAGTVSPADFRGKQIYHLADGSTVASETFLIRALRVGDREVHDVLGSVTNDANALLLGQSFLSRFRSWSIDNQRRVLSLN